MIVIACNRDRFVRSFDNTAPNGIAAKLCPETAMSFRTGLLASYHEIADFDCGIFALDDWLKRRAWSNQINDATRTFVICNEGRVVGYYALAAGSIHTQVVRGSFRRNMPDPIPVAILARLAIDRSCQGSGLGRALFRDAALRVVAAADTIGIRGIVVHAISTAARDFYLALGFDLSPLEPMTLTIALKDLRALV